MTSLLERLRALDRRVIPDRQPTHEQWRRTVRRWPAFLAVAVAEVLLLVGTSFISPDTGAGMAGLMFLAVLLAFQAGQMKAHDDRARGRRGWMSEPPPDT